MEGLVRLIWTHRKWSQGSQGAAKKAIYGHIWQYLAIDRFFTLFGLNTGWINLPKQLFVFFSAKTLMVFHPPPHFLWSFQGYPTQLYLARPETGQLQYLAVFCFIWGSYRPEVNVSEPHFVWPFQGYPTQPYFARPETGQLQYFAVFGFICLYLGIFAGRAKFGHTKWSSDTLTLGR